MSFLGNCLAAGLSKRLAKVSPVTLLPCPAPLRHIMCNAVCFEFVLPAIKIHNLMIIMLVLNTEA